nr:DUF2798 domain-containing protein [Dechloromonas sp.]MBL8412247.1 DUF2798 domain-containing protein [Dechloromonas sp.]
PQKYGPILFSLLLSGLMSLLVSGIATLRAAGLAYGVLGLWMSAWLAAWLVAFPTVILVAPFTQKIVGALVSKT